MAQVKAPVTAGSHEPTIVTIPRVDVLLQYPANHDHANTRPDHLQAYPFNWEHVYNLKGRLLTLVDASFGDVEQRKAFKDMVTQTLNAWMGDREQSCHRVDYSEVDSASQ